MEAAEQYSVGNSMGKMEDFTSQLSAIIWGHRFKEGQRGPEYTLEFLNVMCGTKYSFDQDCYARNKSEWLRKFIFEGVKEGSSREILVLKDEEKQKLVQAVQENNVHVLKGFLRNLEVVLYNTTGKEADRSWYARSLYPLHESLLYVELRQKGKSLLFERNFYARGGELYFLMLASGTESYPERRSFIETRLRELLTKNKIINSVVSKISSAFEDQDDYKETCKLRTAPDDKSEVPKLPKSASIDNRSLFEAFAKELEQLLLLDIDISEMFRLLTALICFQLARYMHVRSYLQESGHVYFCDCLEGNNKHITHLSARNFDNHENLLKTKYEHEFGRKFRSDLGEPEQIERQLPRWKEAPEEFIKLIGLSKMRSRKDNITRVLAKCATADDVLSKLYAAVQSAVFDQLDQVQITRVLARDGGFATYRRGSAANYRYTISDSFLQMLVFTMVRPKGKMEYHEFLNLLYRDYHIVIGDRQAKACGLYDASKLNARYFQDNEKALRNKLRQNGLLIEFSDATAMIQNPYAGTMEAAYA